MNFKNVVKFANFANFKTAGY